MTPFASIVATLMLLLLHSTGLPEEVVAESVWLLPAASSKVEFDNVMTGDSTLTVHCAETSSTVTVMVAVPCLTAVMTPFASIVAIFFELDLNVGFRLDDTAGLSVKVCPR